VSPTINLSPEQVAFFQENGYLSIPRLMSDDEIERIREIYDRLFEARVGREVGD
jgi:hypothetical protein